VRGNFNGLTLINSNAICELATTKFIVGIVEIFGNMTSDLVDKLEKLRKQGTL
jgi:hypothetical protein